jgi:hypothetical protein
MTINRFYNGKRLMNIFDKANVKGLLISNGFVHEEKSKI